MRIVAWATVSCVAAVAISVFAMQRPDFSGQWTADAEAVSDQATGRGAAPQAAGSMGSGWGSPMTMTQDEKELIVEYTPFSRYDIQPPLRLHYALDGSDTRTDFMIGHATQERRSRTAWNGESLEITSVYPALNPETREPFTTEVVQRLSLVSTNVIVIEVTRRALGRSAAVTRTTYRRVIPK